MHILYEHPAELDRLNSLAQEIVKRITAKVKPIESGIKILAGQELFSSGQDNDTIYLLREGDLQCWANDRVIFHYSCGDLVGLEQSFALSHLKVRADFAVVVDRYRSSDLLKSVGADAELVKEWTGYLATLLNLFTTLSASLLTTDTSYTPEVRNYARGDIILKQGELGDEVCHLAEGEADVLVDDVITGEVLTDEIFGAIGAITGIPRTATVRARTDCLVMRLNREKFLDLIKSRPATVEKMIADMAKKLTALNQTVVEYSKRKTVTLH